MSEEKAQKTPVKQEKAKNSSSDNNTDTNNNTIKKEKDEKQVDSKEKNDNKKQINGKKRKKDNNIIAPENVRPGMVIKLWQKIKEKTPKGDTKERLQYFEGTVLARKGGKTPKSTITVRKISHGIGVEKIFPLNLPTITKIELLYKIKTRRSKLYYLKRGYKKRLKKI